MRRLSLIAFVCAPLTAALPARPTAHGGPFDGAWTLEPAYSTTCTAGDVSILVTVGRVYTRQTAPDSLTITSDVAVSGAGMSNLAIHMLTVHFDSATGKFAFSGPVKGSAQRQGYSGRLWGTLDVLGEFESPARIRAGVKTALSMRISVPGTAASGTCTRVDTTIYASRITG